MPKITSVQIIGRGEFGMVDQLGKSKFQGWDAEMPEGGLPYLPVGGIDEMTRATLDLSWAVVMNVVLKDRQDKLQYDSHRLVFFNEFLRLFLFLVHSHFSRFLLNQQKEDVG